MRPYVLTIAGFDPSGGAGVLADVKTFEQHKVLGLAVNTANTFQNESQLHGVQWMNKTEIENQLKPLFSKYSIDYIKIGLIENLDTLTWLISYLKKKNATIRIIWDPIIQASAGFDFHQNWNTDVLHQISQDLFLITPNQKEWSAFSKNGKTPEAWSRNCAILIKGGHLNNSANDVLYENGIVTSFKQDRVEYEKHGSGCVLSAAILAQLALNIRLPEAIQKAKNYITQYLMSNTSLLGYHYHE